MQLQYGISAPNEKMKIDYFLSFFFHRYVKKLLSQKCLFAQLIAASWEYEKNVKDLSRYIFSFQKKNWVIYRSG